MCSYLSFFKQNVFHVHLSDNNYNNPDYSHEYSINEVYAAFRPLSDDPAVEGLNKRHNESYTREEFDNVQRQCANRGVTIIPEIEAPGHALVISQWKPELALDDESLLNISQPETIPTMKTIWKTFLPWFHSKTVHIGADEYAKNLVGDYTHFVNVMNEYIRGISKSGQEIRIWGTFTPSEGCTVSKDITYQHWEFSQDNPYFDYIMNGYDVLNSDDAFYMVGKWSYGDGYPAKLDADHVFHGSPSNGSYAPYMFDNRNASNNPRRDNPNVLGQVACFWNDNGPNATTVHEAYYAYRDWLPALGDKQWGGDLQEEEYKRVFDKLHAAIPDQNLDRNIPSKSDLILQYKFPDSAAKKAKDSSGNGYEGTLHGCRQHQGTVHFENDCYLETPLGSKGRDYTLSFSVKPTTSDPGTLFSGTDSMLVNGVDSVTFFSNGEPYALNYTLPVNKWTNVKVIGKGDHTYLQASTNGGKPMTMEFKAKIGVLAQYFVYERIGIEAPIATIGRGFTGAMRDIELRNGAPDGFNPK